jgi:hypothetical protein
VPGYHVRAEIQRATLVGILRGARKELDLLGNAIAHDLSDGGQQPGRRLHNATALTRKNKSPHTFRTHPLSASFDHSFLPLGRNRIFTTICRFL